MLFWNKICGIIAIIFFSSLSCQAQVVDSARMQGFKTTQYKSLTSVSSGILNASERKLLSPLTVIPQDYYTQHFGIMCKKELALEKATKIPFRFRLGSLQQCNYLEGKK